tara:strand:- start:2322 stop:3152 length:831 start_codon:yes stop_codon:yes gene_type:complete
MGFLTEIKTLEEVPRFEVVKDPLVNSDGEHNGVFALQRSDNGAHLGSCGKKYRPIQMEEMFDVLDTASNRVGGIDHIGYTTTGNGKKVVVQSKLHDEINVDGDPIEGYFYTVVDNTGMGSNKVAPSTQRISCDNAFHLIEKRKGDRLRHSDTFTANVDLMIRRIVDNIQTVKGFGGVVEFLKNAKFSRNQMVKLTQKLIPVEKDESVKRNNKREKLVELYESGVGNVGESKWDAFNAITEFETHNRRQTPEKLVRGLLNGNLANRALKILQPASAA